ncbi:TonB-dependent receptor [Simiduia curdlanivorans]|uniref:TonB-dependent receptor n=1 Tax=Simiduia curdlanivorans TaxID=1492769 RepID=A0ABV8V6G9_9GAMM|nr:TonB-dependent receptor [Simiduia curdlanivorans]MDN3640728.1 TonB-dependent receptor [Simiduia curdlanivorans]
MITVLTCGLLFLGSNATATSLDANTKSLNTNQAPVPSWQFDLPEQALDLSLLQFAQITQINLLGTPAQLSVFNAPALKGQFQLSEGLRLLLVNSGVGFRIDPQGITLFRSTPTQTIKQPRSTNQPERILEEVIVTSLRRATDLQKTPIAVTAMDQNQIDQLQAKDIRDISFMVPGLEMTNTGEQSALLVQLRGIGQTNITEIADGPVAFHVDGIYLPRSQGAASLLHDVDMLEVLRGPQGTLFGRNATSGGINIQTRKADLNDSYGFFSAGLGSYQKQALKLTLNAALTDNFALRFAGASDKHAAYTELAPNYVGLGPQYPTSSDGLSAYKQSTFLHADGPETEDQQSLRLASQWQIHPALNWQLSLERYQDRGTSVTELDPFLVNKGKRLVVWDTPSNLNMQNDTLRSTLSVDIGQYQMRYLLGRARMTREQNFDQDMGRSGHFEQRRTDSSTFDFSSHEIQLVNSDRARLRWVLGAFQSKEQNAIVYAIDHANDDGNGDPTNTTSFISDDPGAAVALFVQPDRRVETQALYAQGTYDLRTQTRLTLGARYTEDTKSDRDGRSLNCRRTAGFPYTEPGSIGTGAPKPEQIYADPATQAAIDAGLPHDQGSNQGIGDQPCWVRQVNDYKATWTNTSGLLRLDHDLQDQVMVYGSLASGFKSGHIQDRGNEAAPEEVINTELGLKSSWLQETLRINAALYRAEYTNLQFSDRDQFDTDDDGIVDVITSTIVRNAAEATVKGLEVELSWTPNAAHFVQLAGSLMDAQFDNFETPDTLFGDRFNPYANKPNAAENSLVDLSGNRPVRAPRWKLSFLYEYQWRWQALRLTPRLVGTLSDRYYLDIYNRDSLPANTYPGAPDGVDNLAIQEAYAKFDLSLRAEPSAGEHNWSVEAYIKNATDSAVKTASGTFITPAGFDAVFLPPRTAGLTLNIGF